MDKCNRIVNVLFCSLYEFKLELLIIVQLCYIIDAFINSTFINMMSTLSYRLVIVFIVLLIVIKRA